MPAKRRQGGFTLIELIVVLVIMAVLAAAALPAMTKYIGQAKETTAMNDAGVVVRAAKAETVTLSAMGAVGDWKEPEKKAEVVSSVGLKGEIKQVTISDGGILTGLYYEAANGILVSYQAQRSPTLQVEQEVPAGGDVIGGSTGPAKTVKELGDRSNEVAEEVIKSRPDKSYDRATVAQEVYKANGNTFLQVENGLEAGSDWKKANPTKGPLYWRPYTLGSVIEVQEKGMKPRTLLYANTGNEAATKSQASSGFKAILLYWDGVYYQSATGKETGVGWAGNIKASATSEEVVKTILANGFVVYQTGTAPT